MESVLLAAGVVIVIVAIVVVAVYVVKRRKHEQLVTQIDQELNEAAGVDEGPSREMKTPTDQEKEAAEREMWEGETN